MSLWCKGIAVSIFSIIYFFCSIPMVIYVSNIVGFSLGFLIIAAGYFLVASFSHFLKCKNCGHDIFKGRTGWYGIFPHRTCTRCGEDLTKA